MPCGSLAVGIPRPHYVRAYHAVLWLSAFLALTTFGQCHSALWLLAASPSLRSGSPCGSLAAGSVSGGAFWRCRVSMRRRSSAAVLFVRRFAAVAGAPSGQHRSASAFCAFAAQLPPWPLHPTLAVLVSCRLRRQSTQHLLPPPPRRVCASPRYYSHYYSGRSLVRSAARRRLNMPPYEHPSARVPVCSPLILAALLLGRLVPAAL